MAVKEFQRFLVLYATAGALLIFHQNVCAAKVMMEYIGATGAPITFAQVPIRDGIDFHFILGFAVDAGSSDPTRQGAFSPYWEDSLTPAAISAVKSNHTNVKVLVSLSGWSIGGRVLQWYKPKHPDHWIFAAFTSIKNLTETYHLDGIDIDYENFKRRDHENFAVCIGELITMLKNQSVISVATIAPYYKTVSPYADLFKNYSTQIDYVNYQFYTDKVKSPDGYLKAFKNRAELFDGAKLLPSYEVRGRGLRGDSFLEAVRHLQKNGFDLNGVMIYSADASVQDGFYSEINSQAFLLNTTASP